MLRVLMVEMSLVWSGVADVSLVQTQTRAREFGTLKGYMSGQSGDFLVLAATHGAGSTMVSEAPDKHPCIISVGEPFSSSEKLYAPDGYLEDGETALFRDHSEPDPQGTFSKLTGQIKEAVGKDIQVDDDMHMQASSITGFFADMRRLACDNYDLIDACGGRCIFSHKMFPDYVANDFLTVQHYLTDERTAVFHLMRNETDVAASNARRFGSYSDKKVARDLEWHDFLSNLGGFGKSERNWLEVHAEDMFRSPADYYEPLRKVFLYLNLNNEALVEPVRSFIEAKFAQVAASEHTSR